MDLTHSGKTRSALLALVCALAICSDLCYSARTVNHDSGDLVTVGHCHRSPDWAMPVGNHNISLTSSYGFLREEMLTIQISLAKTGETGIALDHLKHLTVSAMLQWQHPGGETTTDCVTVAVPATPFACLNNFSGPGNWTCALPPRRVVIPRGVDAFNAVITAGFKKLLCGALAEKRQAKCNDSDPATLCVVYCQTQGMTMTRSGKPMFNFTNPKSRITEEGNAIIKVKIFGPYGWEMYTGVQNLTDRATEHQALAFFQQQHHGTFPEIFCQDNQTYCTLDHQGRNKWRHDRKSNTVDVTCSGSEDGTYVFSLTARSAYGSRIALVSVSHTAVRVITDPGSVPLASTVSFSLALPR